MRSALLPLTDKICVVCSEGVHAGSFDAKVVFCGLVDPWSHTVLPVFVWETRTKKREVGKTIYFAQTSW